MSCSREGESRASRLLWEGPEFAFSISPTCNGPEMTVGATPGTKGGWGSISAHSPGLRDIPGRWSSKQKEGWINSTSIYPPTVWRKTPKVLERIFKLCNYSVELVSSKTVSEDGTFLGPDFSRISILKCWGTLLMHSFILTQLFYFTIWSMYRFFLIVPSMEWQGKQSLGFHVLYKVSRIVECIFAFARAEEEQSRTCQKIMPAAVTCVSRFFGLFDPQLKVCESKLKLLGTFWFSLFSLILTLFNAVVKKYSLY